MKLKRLVAAILASAIVLSGTDSITAYAGSIEEAALLPEQPGNESYDEQTDEQSDSEVVSVDEEDSSDIQLSDDDTASDAGAEDEIIEEDIEDETSEDSEVSDEVIGDEMNDYITSEDQSEDIEIIDLDQLQGAIVDHGDFCGCFYEILRTDRGDILSVSSNSYNIEDFSEDAPWKSYTDTIVGLNLSMRMIPDYAFANMTKVTDIALGESLRYIGEGAFYNCGVLRINFSGTASVRLPDRVETIGEDAFANCPNLTSIDLPANLANFSSFKNYSNLQSVKVNGRISNLYGTFGNCSSLKTVYLPSSLKQITSNDFSGCTSLETVYFEGTYNQWRTICNYSDVLNSNVEVICNAWESRKPETKRLHLVVPEGWPFYICTPGSYAIQEITEPGEYDFDLQSYTVINFVNTWISYLDSEEALHDFNNVINDYRNSDPNSFVIAYLVPEMDGCVPTIIIDGQESYAFPARDLSVSDDCDIRFGRKEFNTDAIQKEDMVSFYNSLHYYLTDEDIEKCKKYLPWNYRVDLFDYPGGATQWGNLKKAGYGGICYGASTEVVAAKLRYLLPFDFGARIINDLSKDSIDTQRLFTMMHIGQYSPKYILTEKLFARYSIRNKLAILVEAARAAQNHEGPSVLVYSLGLKKGTHAVVVNGINEVDLWIEGEHYQYEIVTYDINTNEGLNEQKGVGPWSNRIKENPQLGYIYINDDFDGWTVRSGDVFAGKMQKQGLFDGQIRAVFNDEATLCPFFEPGEYSDLQYLSFHSTGASRTFADGREIDTELGAYYHGISILGADIGGENESNEYRMYASDWVKEVTVECDDGVDHSYFNGANTTILKSEASHGITMNQKDHTVTLDDVDGDYTAEIINEEADGVIFAVSCSGSDDVKFSSDENGIKIESDEKQELEIVVKRLGEEDQVFSDIAAKNWQISYDKENETTEVACDYNKPGVMSPVGLKGEWNPQEDDTEYGDILDEDRPEDGVIPEGIWVAGIKDTVYDATAKKQSIRVYDENHRLEENKDYTLTFKNNKKAYTYSDEDYAAFEEKLKSTGKRIKTGSFDPVKAPSAVIKMKGNYGGSQTVYFRIEPKSLNSSEFFAGNMTVQYSGKKQTPAPVLNWNGKKLTYNKDFYVKEYNEQSKNKTAFTGSKDDNTDYLLTIVGKGNFTGELYVNLKIVSTNVIGDEVTLPVVLMNKVTVAKIPPQPFKEGDDSEIRIEDLKDSKGNPYELKVTYKGKTLVRGTDYEVDLSDKSEVGNARITLRGLQALESSTGFSFAGSKNISFAISGYPMSKVTIEGINKNGYVYNADKVTLSGLTVRYSKDKNTTITLEEGKHYNITYSKNDKAGTATAVFVGMSSFTGSKKVTFKINPLPVDDESVIVNDGKIPETDYVKGAAAPKINVSVNGTSLTEGKDYVLKYKNQNRVYTDSSFTLNNPPTIIIQGKGNYKGSRTVNNLVLKSKLTGKVTAYAKDMVVSGKAGGFKAPLVLKDSNGKQLVAGTDYEKEIVYRYFSDAVAVQGKGDAAVSCDRKKGDLVEQADLVPAGTILEALITGKGAYEGDISAYYRIIESGCDIGKAQFRIAAKKYIGRDVHVTLTEEDITKAVLGKTNLIYGTDYTIVEYSDNSKVGTAKVTIAGCGKYGGTKTVTFKIGYKSILQFWKGLFNR